MLEGIMLEPSLSYVVLLQLEFCLRGTGGQKGDRPALLLERDSREASIQPASSASSSQSRLQGAVATGSMQLLLLQPMAVLVATVMMGGGRHRRRN